MKYSVQIQYTNPSHEHVSLRRRVDTVTRLVEASNEQEALNRAANQQRALGFMIKEAKVVKEKNYDKKAGDEETVVAKGTESYPTLKPGQKLKPVKLKMGEGFDPEPKDIAAHLVSKHGKGKVTKDHVDAYERGDRDSNKGIDKEAVMKHVQKMSEEVEQIDELNRILKSYINKSIETGRANDAKGDHNLYMATSKVARNLATPTLKNKVSKLKYTSMAKHKNPYEYQVSRDELANRKVSEEVVTEAEREAGYKMPAHVAAGQKKFDAQAKGQNKPRPQAGTLAALAAQKAHNAAQMMVKRIREMKDDKRATEAAKIKLNNEKKKVNKINMKPSVEVKG